MIDIVFSEELEFVKVERDGRLVTDGKWLDRPHGIKVLRLSESSDDPQQVSLSLSAAVTRTCSFCYPHPDHSGHACQSSSTTAPGLLCGCNPAENLP